MKKGAAPLKKGIISVKRGAAPEKVEIVPVKRGAAPMKRGAVPVKKGGLSGKEGRLPGKKEILLRTGYAGKGFQETERLSFGCRPGRFTSDAGGRQSFTGWFAGFSGPISALILVSRYFFGVIPYFWEKRR
jgi:hypothetical protein